MSGLYLPYEPGAQGCLQGYGVFLAGEISPLLCTQVVLA